MANLRMIGGTRGAHTRHVSSRGIGLPLVLFIVVLVVIYVVVQLVRPAPSVTLETASQVSWTVPGAAPSLPWPTTGSAALEEVGVGSLGHSGSDAAVPIASIAKVLTAYVVLQDHPIAPDSEGGNITVTPDVVSNYQTGLAGDQSEVAVTAGETITELEALEGLLVGSGNDMALLLAEWDAGTETAFIAKMNSEAQKLGLTSTHITDPSGLDPGTVSTPSDLLHLAQVAMAVPTLEQVVAMPEATLPVAGVVYNVNADLGKDGIVGIKTGTDPEAGGCLLFQAQETTSAGPVTLIGVVLGQQAASILTAALSAADTLVKAAFAAMQSVPLVTPGQSLGRVEAPWGASAAVTASSAAHIATLPGVTLHGTIRRVALGSSVAAGAKVGVLEVKTPSGTVPITLRVGSAVSGPGIGWRLTDL